MESTTPRTFKIVDLAKVPSAETGRVGKYDLIVTYQDSVGRVRIVTLPNEEFEGKDEEAQAAILKKYITVEETERTRFVGKEIAL